MAHERLRPQFLFDEEKIRQLKQLAPECFEDGKINFETLKQNLGDWAQDEEDPELEHFGLFWPGKRNARRAASLPPEGTLEPVYGEGLKADGTPDTDGVNDSQNIFIEGENLEVLKILQKSYAGKIKMIYIDPPYNTGNDFVYDDNFTEPLQEYLRRTGQVDEEGKPLTTNKRSDGRFHSKWLSMMYPRLRLARNLLRDDGSIFISIDDNEVHNLRSIMNEIFGEESFIAEIIWQRTFATKNDAKYLSTEHEYILFYCKDINVFAVNSLERTEKQDQRYSNPDNDPRGPWTSTDLLRMEHRDNSVYTITSPSGKQWTPQSGTSWRHPEDEMTELINNNEVTFGKDGNAKPRRKRFLKDVKQGIVPQTIWKHTEVGHTQEAKQHLNKLFDGKPTFSTPKPVRLMNHLLKIATTHDQGDIVLDFFGGSGTIAESIISENVRLNGNRSFICVQLPEKCEETSDAFKSGFSNIAAIASERIRRAHKFHKATEGFKYLSLGKSNYKNWFDYAGNQLKELETKLDLFNQAPLSETWNQNSLLIEILLIEGFTLSCSVIKLNDIKSNDIFKASEPYSNHSLLICLDKELKMETVQALKISGDEIFICLDTAISNVDKLRLSDKGLIKTI